MSRVQFIVNIHRLKHVCMLKNECKQWYPIGFMLWFFFGFCTILLNRLLCYCSYSAIVNYSISWYDFFSRISMISFCSLAFAGIMCKLKCQIKATLTLKKTSNISDMVKTSKTLAWIKSN